MAIEVDALGFKTLKSGKINFMTFMVSNTSKTLGLIFLSVVLSTGCARTVVHHPLTPAEYKQIELSTLTPERFWGDAAPPNLEQAIKKDAPFLRERFPEAVNATPETAPLTSLLAISGGGANGAFGAGILAGWTESGERPEFEVVTGVSTGAIIAPFAFLGPEYDPLLLKMYSTVNRDKVFFLESWVGMIFGSALADTKPLKKLIDTYITLEVVEAIAEQARLKRSLFIVTTHFDATRPMVWNIGAIAERRGEQAVPLIRKIILASMAIPVLFPPVPIEWEIDGKSFTELHVDGGVSSQVFAYPVQIPVGRLNEILGLTFRRQIFLIQNGNGQSDYEPAPVKIAPIAERTLKTLLRNQENANIDQIYYQAQRDGIEFKKISIPNSIKADRGTEFDPEYMRSLQKAGREIGRRGDFWQNPPSTQSLKP